MLFFLFWWLILSCNGETFSLDYFSREAMAHRCSVQRKKKKKKNFQGSMLMGYITTGTSETMKSDPEVLWNIFINLEACQTTKLCPCNVSQQYNIQHKIIHLLQLASHRNQFSLFLSNCKINSRVVYVTRLFDQKCVLPRIRLANTVVNARQWLKFCQTHEICMHWFMTVHKPTMLYNVIMLKS